jgi:hypothetical protein
LACTYAALILHDDGHQVTAEKINKILKAANVTVEPFWPTLFERVLKNKKLDDLILAVGSGAFWDSSLFRSFRFVNVVVLLSGMFRILFSLVNKSPLHCLVSNILFLPFSPCRRSRRRPCCRCRPCRW